MPGEPVHAFLSDLDRAWERSAASSSWGARQRFLAAVEQLRETWPLQGGPSRWRLGEVTVDWAAVAPLGDAT